MSAGRGVAEHGVVPDPQERLHPPDLPRGMRVADRVDAPADGDQPAALGLSA